MKLLIIEGPDRTGKDTLIKNISEEYPFRVYSHFGFPKGETLKEKHQYQMESFNREFNLQHAIRNEWHDLQVGGLFLGQDSNHNPKGIYIWNRSHIGECVYGPMYRSSKPDWIYQMEEAYLADDYEVCLVYLYADPEFLVKNDDGKSHSADLTSKEAEIALFHQAVDKSCIKNKVKIKVNDGNHYTDAGSILSIVKRAIGE
jgi:thymidylate kinase